MLTVSTGATGAAPMHEEKWETIGERNGHVRVQRSTQGRVRLAIGVSDNGSQSYHGVHPEALAEALLAAAVQGEAPS